MKQGIICPVDHLKDFAVLSDYHLVLAHIVEKSEVYRNFYKNLSDEHFITLDNSSFEVGDGVYSPDDLVCIANQVGADEIMAPEVFEDGIATAKNIINFCSVIKRCNPIMGVFGTLHGMTMKEIINCFLEVYKLVDTIGFSCRLSVKDFEVPVSKSRGLSWKKSIERFCIVKELFRYIENEGLNVSHLEFHLLGLNHPLELSWYDKSIRSCDSSCAYANGYDGRSLKSALSKLYEKPKEKLDFFSDVKGSSKWKIIYDNVTYLDVLMKNDG